MNRRRVTSAICDGRRLASSYVSRLNGAASPGWWHDEQWAKRMGATSRLNVTSAAANVVSAATPPTRSANPATRRRQILSRGGEIMMPIERLLRLQIADVTTDRLGHWLCDGQTCERRDNSVFQVVFRGRWPRRAQVDVQIVHATSVGDFPITVKHNGLRRNRSAGLGDERVLRVTDTDARILEIADVLSNRF